MSKLKAWILASRRSIAVTLGGGALSLTLLLAHLGSFTHGINHDETTTQQLYASLSVIAHTPVNLPILVVHWLTSLWLPLNAFWLRIPSVIFAGLALASMAYVLRRWYGIRTAIFSYVLFACSAWILHVGRFAGPDILLVLLLPSLYVSHIVLHDFSSSRLASYFWLFVQITLLYVPGGIWFVALNMWLQRGEILGAVTAFKSVLGRAGVTTFGLVLFAPLAVSFVVGSPKTIGLALAGLPAAMPTVTEIGHNVANALLFIGVRGNAPDALWLNHLPILDGFLLIAFITGVYFYGKHWRANRSKLLFGSLFIGLALIASGGAVTIGVLVPVLFLIVAAGIAYLLHLWLAVFPRNPLARGVGITLISLAVASSCWYNLRQYFVAWPHHSATKAVYTERKVIRSHL